MGTWWIDIDDDRLRYDAVARAMLGHDVRPGRVPPTALLSTVHPSDLTRASAALDDLRHHGVPVDLEHRVIRRDGSVRWIRVRGSRADDRRSRRARGTVVDITEQHDLQDRLRESHAAAERGLAELEAVYRSAPVGLGVLDPDLRFVRVNDRLAAMHGVPVSEHIGRTLREVAPGLAESAEPILRRVLGGETVLDVAIGGDTPASPAEARIWNVSYYPITDAAGSVIAINKVAEDITERTRIMAELARGRDRMHLAMRAARMFSFERDLRTNTIVRSDECTAILGSGCCQVDWPSFIGSVHPDDRERLVGLVRKLIPSQAHYTTVYRMTRRDGLTVSLEETARGAFDAKGTLVHVYGLVADVTPRETLIAALRESHATLGLLTSAVPAMLFTCAPSGDCDYVNRWFYDFIGDDGDLHALGNWLDTVDERDRDETRARWLAAVDAGTPFGAELRFRAHDGTHRWFKVQAVPMAGETGAIAKWIGAASDIDSVKRAQEELHKADRRKDEFLAMLAHELRNPLAPVLNTVNTLALLTRDDPTLLRLADILGRQARHMGRLLDDLLEVSRITVGRIRLRMGLLDLRRVATDAADMNRPLFAQRTQRLELNLPDTPLWVNADATRLVQALGNLLNNASKYTPDRGTVTIDAWAADRRAQLAVRDSGVGMEPELTEGVFDLFTQGRQALDRAQGGLGIGLALVRRIADLHGGGVSAASDGPGTGSRFDVWLPLAPGPPDGDRLTSSREGAEAHGPRTSGRRVLVVDDNVDAAEILAKGLTLLGHDVRVSFEGADALATAAAFRPDVAILDLGLPGLDGFEVARRMRALDGCESTRLIALTGYGQPEHKHRSSAVGFERHLVKPVELQELATVIDP